MTYFEPYETVVHALQIEKQLCISTHFTFFGRKKHFISYQSIFLVLCIETETKISSLYKFQGFLKLIDAAWTSKTTDINVAK